MKNYNIGDKVVPHKKTRGAVTLEHCNSWQSAKDMGQDFLYVVGYGTYGVNPIQLSYHMNGSGNAYNSDDVTPYIEGDKDALSHIVKIEELVRLYNIGYIQEGTDIKISKV